MSPVKKLVLLLTLTGSLMLSGCFGVNANSIGAGPLPILPEPAPLVFNEAETNTLNRWASEDKELFKKLQGQVHAYRATVRSYNKDAAATNKKKLELMGFKDNDLKAVLDADNDSSK